MVLFSAHTIVSPTQQSEFSRNFRPASKTVPLSLLCLCVSVDTWDDCSPGPETPVRRMARNVVSFFPSALTTFLCGVSHSPLLGGWFRFGIFCAIPAGWVSTRRTISPMTACSNPSPSSSKRSRTSRTTWLLSEFRIPDGFNSMFPLGRQAKKSVVVCCDKSTINPARTRSKFFCSPVLRSSSPSWCSEDFFEIVVFCFPSQENLSRSLAKPWVWLVCSKK